jgi:hypothetical protein
MPRLRTALLCVLATTVAMPVLAAPAQASRTMLQTFEAPRDLFDPDRRGAALAELESLGVRALRVTLYWRDVAPASGSSTVPPGDLADPGSYDWSRYDPVIGAARERGWDVLLTVSGPVPKWATARRNDHHTRPSPARFERFMEAVGRRYGGQVRTWGVWNEPNHPNFLRPQYDSRRRAVSPGIYRRLFQAGHRGLVRAGQGDDTILAGETAPIGTGRVVTPLRFLRGTLCLDSRYRRNPACGRLPADGWAHHPYTRPAGPWWRSSNGDDVTIGTLSRLTRALDRAGRAGALRRGLGVWITEFGVQSTPDRWSGVSLAKQVEHYALSERIAWSNPRVRSFAQYLLRDSDPIPGKVGAARYAGFESGLRFANGRAKPSLAAYRLTLSAIRTSRKRVTLWGRVRTARGPTTATILYQPRGRRTFRTLRTVRTDARGAFSARVANVEGRRWRLRHGEHQGHPIRAYSRPR